MQIDLSKSAGTDVIAHELFHEIDETYGLTDNGMLKDSIQADYQKLQESRSVYKNGDDGKRRISWYLRYFAWDV